MLRNTKIHRTQFPPYWAHIFMVHTQKTNVHSISFALIEVHANCQGSHCIYWEVQEISIKKVPFVLVFGKSKLVSVNRGEERHLWLKKQDSHRSGNVQ